MHKNIDSVQRIKLTFIVPIYNMEKYLHRCLSSLQQQTDPAIEVIMVNDGSTDRSDEICESFAASDSRFRYIYQENAWLSAARNAGLDAATGEYISFLDPDDYINVDFCESLFPHASISNPDILVFGFQMDYEGEECPKLFRISDKNVHLSLDNLEKHFCVDWLLPQRTGYVCTKLYKRSFIETFNIRFPQNVRFAEDRYFNYVALPNANSVLFCDIAPYHYFQHAKSACHVTARKENIIPYYLRVYQDVVSIWNQQGMTALDTIKPILLLRMIQASFYSTTQAVHSVEKMADYAVEAFSSFPLKEELCLTKVEKAMNIYAKHCNMSWKDTTKEWLFILSLMDGKEGIIAWQRLYPHYLKLISPA